MTWKTLQHPNVLPLMGVTMSEGQFAMVSEWMVGGNINEYVEANPDANRLKLVRFRSKSRTLRVKFVDIRVTFLAERRCSRVDIHPSSWNDPRRPQGGGFSAPGVALLSHHVVLLRLMC